MRVFVRAYSLSLSLFFCPPSPRLRRAQYPERDLNPHSLNGHRILSPACLPFHHPGGIKIQFYKQSPVGRTLSRLCGNSTIRAELKSNSTNRALRVGPCPAFAGIPPSGQEQSCGHAVVRSCGRAGPVASDGQCKISN